jgi:hypothetical protein
MRGADTVQREAAAAQKRICAAPSINYTFNSYSSDLPIWSFRYRISRLSSTASIHLKKTQPRSPFFFAPDLFPFDPPITFAASLRPDLLPRRAVATVTAGAPLSLLLGIPYSEQQLLAGREAPPRKERSTAHLFQLLSSHISFSSR